MRILGIDPGTGILGFGVIDCNGRTSKMVDAGVIRTPPHQPLPERLVTIFNELTEIFDTHKPQALSVERLFFARNVTTAMSVSHARGVVLLLGQQRAIPIFEYTPQQIKQSVTGQGKADKKQVQEMVRMLLRLKEIPKPDDAADALAAALTHSQAFTL
ncbi:MAG TPA: crossover junction endodeoxyribonuclease RuvC [Candidatus Saccharimonadales bacterium]|nr:crossover junction endodeoxyribonuclease RuvC [Candidatus Saccharimonadales bacterium]